MSISSAVVETNAEQSARELLAAIVRRVKFCKASEVYPVRAYFPLVRRMKSATFSCNSFSEASFAYTMCPES